MKLALGTVQFGLAYGVANATGQLSAADAAQTLAIARDAGIGMLDTAAAYGDAEAQLGDLGVDGFEIVTKLPAVPADVADVSAWTERTVRHSLMLLRQPRLYAVLLHRAGDALGARGAAIGAVLRQLQDEGVVRGIGVSVYEPAELEPIAGMFPLQVVQAPFNPFDQRITRSGWAARIREAGGELHVRSVFLQGVLLQPAVKRHGGFRQWSAAFDAYDAWLAASGGDPVAACLAHALDEPAIDRVVVGVDGPRHLADIVRAASVRPALVEAASLATDDARLLHPSRWSEFLH